MEFRRKFRVRSVVLLATTLQLLAAVFGVATLLAPQSANAVTTIPYLINFQGRLTDNNGNVLSDGSYNIKFRIFDAASSGTNLWEGDRVRGASDHRITVTNGLFNIQFGDTSQGDPALSPSLFSTGTQLYLEVELPTPATATCSTNGCAVFTEGAMTPRQPLASTPYAFNSDTLDGLDSSAFAQLASANTFTAANLFAPTTSSTVALTVKATTAGSTNSLEVFDSGGTRQAFFDATGALTLAQAITAPTTTNTINSLVINAGALSGITGYAQASGGFLQSGSGTFGTATGAVSLNGDTTVAAGKNLILPSGTGTFQQTFSSPTAAASGQSLAFTNSNTVAAGVTMQGINITPTVNAPTSGTNILNIVNFAVGTALTAAENANGINFASAVGYTNFINTPTAKLSSAGAFTGVASVTVTATTASGFGANTVTTQPALTATGVTTGSGVTAGGANTTSGSGLIYSAASNTLSTGSALSVTTGGAAITAAYTGNLVNVVVSRTHTAATAITDTGSFLNLNRSLTNTNAGGSFTVTGALANLQSTCVQTLGTCADSSNILNLNQQYASSSGTVLNVQGAGTGNLANLDASNASANGVAIDVQSSGTGQYVLKLTSNNAATNVLFARADGHVGIGTTTPSQALDVNGTINGTGFSSGGTAGVGSTVSCGANQAVTAAVFTTGLLTTAPTCSAITGTGAATDLSNLTTTAVNQSLIAGTNNSLDLGSTAKDWKNVFTGNVDAGTITTALTIGTSNATSIQVGKSGLAVSLPGGLTTSGANVTAGAGTVAGATINATSAYQANGTAGVGVSCSGSQANLGAVYNQGILTTAGTCTAVQAAGNYLVQAPAGTANTITAASGGQALIIKGTNGTSADLVDIYNTAVSPAIVSKFDFNGAFTTTAALVAPTSTDTINGLIVNAGALSGVSTISTSGAINGQTIANAASFVTSVSAPTISASTILQSPSLDTISGTALTIGATHATSISLQQATSVTSGNTFAVAGGLTSLTAGATGDALNVSNGSSTGNIAVLADGATPVVLVADGGAVTLQNSLDSTGAFQILTAGGTPKTVLAVDTTVQAVSLDANLLVNSSVPTPSGLSIADAGNTGGSLSGSSTAAYFYQVSGITGSGESPASREIEIGGTNFTAISPPSSAPTLSYTGTSSLTGKYYYRVSFVTADGETTAEPATAQASPASRQIVLSAIPTGPTGTISRNIYRTIKNGADTTELFLTTIADNTTTTYTDAAADSLLGGAMPTVNTARTDNNQATISYSSMAGATSYRIYRGTASGAESAYQTTTLTTFTDTGAAGTAGTPITPTTGRVGIGTATPGYKLDVESGNINVSGAYVQGSANIGQTVSCGTGQTFSGLTVSGGIVTGVGACGSLGSGSGSSSSLQSAYNNSTDPEITLGPTSTSGLTILDNSSAISGPLFQVQDSAATSNYFSVTSTGIASDNGLTLGNTAIAGQIVLADGTANNYTVSLGTSALTGSYSLDLPTSAPSTSQCLQSGASTASQLEWSSCSASVSVQAVDNATASFTSGLANAAANSLGQAVETLVFTSATAVSNTAGATGFTAPASGSFRTCLVKNNANITAGTLGLRWRVNGVSVGSSACNMDSTTANRRSASTALDAGVVTFSAGDTIGIAFDTSSAYLPITDDYTAYWTVEYNSTTGLGSVFLQGGNSFGATATIGTADSYDLTFVTNGTERVRIDATTGNVGIGTTAGAGNKLDVSGNANATSYSAGGTAGSSISTCGAGQYVGSFQSTSGLVTGGSCSAPAGTYSFNTAGDSGTSTVASGQTVTIQGGNGLTSTDDGSRNISLDVGAGTGISVGANTVGVDQTAALAWTGTESFNKSGGQGATFNGSAASGGAQLQFGSVSALNGGSANGTYLGANPAAYTGDLLNFAINSVNKLKVDNSGNEVLAGGLNIGSGTVYSVGAAAGQSSTVACSANQAVTTATFTGGILTTAPGCATINGTGATTTLNNLGTTSIDADLLPDSSANNRSLGSGTDIWKNLYTTNVDTQTTTNTALTIGASNATTIQIGKSGVAISAPGGLTTSGGAINTGTGAITSTSTITGNLFSGSGASLTSLPAANLTGTYAALNGAAITSLDPTHFLVPASGAVTLQAAASSALNITTTGTGAITVAAGTGGFNANFAAGVTSTFTNTAAMTADQLAQTNTSAANAPTADGINLLQQTFFGKPSGTNSESSTRINVTNSNTGAGGQVNGLRVVAVGAGGAVASDTDGIMVDNLTNASSGAAENALEVGTGWDSGFYVQSGGNTITTATVPAADQLTVDNTGSTGVTGAGINGISVKYKGGAAAVEAAGMRIDFTPGTTSGGTWSGLRIVAGATGAVTGVTEYGLKLEGPTSPGAGTEEGAYVGTGWDIGIDVQSGGLQLAAQAQPATPLAGQLRIWAQDIAGRVMPKWVGPSGVDTPFQASLGFNRVVWAGPSGGAACATYSVFGTAAGTTAGTCANPAPASTNLLTSTRRMTYSTGTTAGTAAYQRQGTMQVWRGNAAGEGGFFYTQRFGTDTLQNGNRAFVGLSDLAANPTNIDPTTSTTYGKVGMAINASTGNWNIINNVSGTAPTITALGASFPVNATSLYELVLFSAPNGTSIGWRVTNISTGAQTSGSIAANMPANTTFLAPLFWIDNNATAAAAIIDWDGWYLESDN